MWSCCGSVNADKLERLQRRAALIAMLWGSSEKALNFLGYDNKDVLPRRPRSKSKLTLPSIKLECTRKAFIIMVV